MTTPTEIDRQNAEPWRLPDGRFGVGNPGKPPGTKGRSTKAELIQLDKRKAAVWAGVDQKIAEGCTKTILFLLARMLPPERVIELDSTDPAAVSEAVTDGTISPAEAAKLAVAVRSLRDVEQMDQMKARLDQIEALLAAKART